LIAFSQQAHKPNMAQAWMRDVADAYLDFNAAEWEEMAADAATKGSNGAALAEFASAAARKGTPLYLYSVTMEKEVRVVTRVRREVPLEDDAAPADGAAADVDVTAPGEDGATAPAAGAGTEGGDASAAAPSADAAAAPPASEEGKHEETKQKEAADAAAASAGTAAAAEGAPPAGAGGEAVGEEAAAATAPTPRKTRIIEVRSIS
jgi:hypothetical protein